jgi:glycosyltransferase involved in cell wall biosynthesis
VKLQGTKILNFINSLATGGTERQFVHATRALHEKGLSMHAGFIIRKGEFLQDLQSLGLPMSEYATGSMYSYRTVRQQLRLRRDLRHVGIRILHAYGFYANVFAVPAARLARTPAIVASVRDTGIYLTPMMRRAQKAACRMAHGVVANSGAVRDWLVNDGLDATRIHVIRNGIIVPEAHPAGEPVIRKQLGIASDAPVVATVCRLNRSKGIEHLLQAAAGVVREVPNIRFLVVGKDSNEAGYKEELERTATELNLGSHVLFMGERKDVPDVLREVDLFVLPSLSEGLSNVLLEAMAAGLPVVATNVGGNPEIVLPNETGLLVQAKNSAELSTAICQLLKNRDLSRRFGDAGRQRVTTHFSVQSMVTQTQDLYESLLDDRATRQVAA